MKSEKEKLLELFFSEKEENNILAIQLLEGNPKLMREITELDLSGSELEEFPTWIFSLEYLEILKLAYNAIQEIPPQIAKLQKLKKLDLFQNKIKDISPKIGQLKNLEELNLRHNKFRHLPDEIAQLENLEILWLQDISSQEEFRIKKLLPNCEIHIVDQ